MSPLILLNIILSCLASPCHTTGNMLNGKPIKELQSECLDCRIVLRNAPKEYVETLLSLYDHSKLDIEFVDYTSMEEIPDLSRYNIEFKTVILRNCICRKDCTIPLTSREEIKSLIFECCTLDFNREEREARLPFLARRVIIHDSCLKLQCLDYLIHDKATRYLEIVECTLVGATTLADLKNLNNRVVKLKIANMDIGDQELKGLESVFANVIDLQLVSLGISAETISCLPKLKNLKELSLEECPMVNSLSIPAIRQCKKLYMISLGGTKLTRKYDEEIKQGGKRIMIWH